MAHVQWEPAALHFQAGVVTGHVHNRNQPSRTDWSRADLLGAIAEWLVHLGTVDKGESDP